MPFGFLIDGTLDHHALSGIAGISNIGADRNWTGSEFDQANWFAFGRLAWDPTLVRLLYILVSVISAAFPGILVYLVLWVVMPQASD